MWRLLAADPGLCLGPPPAAERYWPGSKSACFSGAGMQVVSQGAANAVGQLVAMADLAGIQVGVGGQPAPHAAGQTTCIAQRTRWDVGPLDGPSGAQPARPGMCAARPLRGPHSPPLLPPHPACRRASGLRSRRSLWRGS